MRAWVDVLDALGNRLGDGALMSLLSASVTRNLDGVGSLELSFPATDIRVAQLLRQERRLRVMVDDGQAVREWGSGIVRQLSYRESASGWTLVASCPDSLDELKRHSVLFNRAYNNQAIPTLVSDLVSSVAGWSVSTSAVSLVSARFDAVSVLKALQDLIKLQGLHLRLGTAKTLEVGSFGASSGVTLMNVPQITQAMYEDDSLAFIESLSQTVDSEALVNRLYVLGAGANVDSALTLQQATRTSPYPIQSMTAYGRTLYYIEDSASIALYGVIERVGQFKEIAPLSNNAIDVERAANALYDAAAAWLLRYKDPQESYSLRVKKLSANLSVGDKVRLVYHEPILRADGSFVPPRNLDAEFWVMSLTERLGVGGVSTQLELSLSDRYDESVAKTLIGSLDQIRLQGMTVQPSINHFQAGPEQVHLDASTSAKVQLIFTDATFSLDRVLMRVRTQPFVATAKSALSVTSQAGGSLTQSSSGGGSHNHRVMALTTLSGFPSTTLRPYLAREASSGSLLYVRLETSAEKDLWTYDASDEHSHSVSIPAHTHIIPPAPLVYGLHRDNQRPANMLISVNGASVTPSPIGSASADLDLTIDITPQVLGKAGGFRGVHDVVLTCSTGQGEVLVTFDVYETITPFRFGS